MVGLFWDDTPPPKPPKAEKIVRTPPEPVWLLPSYLPGLEEAQAMRIDIFNDQELIEASRRGEKLTYDIECYPNYLLIAFRSRSSGKYILFELIVINGNLVVTFDHRKLWWVLTNFTLVGFNILKYDNIIATLACYGCSAEQLWQATQMLIVKKLKKDGTFGAVSGYNVLKTFKVNKLPINSIDLIEYTALRPGLKVCAGRMHAPRMQDLPFVPGSYLTLDQITITRWYCVNDLDNTDLLFNRYVERLKLREHIGARYNIDLRSSSDAQMAEGIMTSEIKRLTGQKHLPKTKIEPGTCYQYKLPNFIKFETPLLNRMLNIVVNSIFEISEKGSLTIPTSIKGMLIPINDNYYKFGLGGLHSQEKAISHLADDETEIVDIDATSYYPFLILNAGLTPENLGQNFLIVYNGIVVARVNAKEAGDVITAEGLKISVNGIFGKLGSKWSVVYAPQLLMQTTVTGQLSLLMYIERMELNNFKIISANTDGVVTLVPKARRQLFNSIVKQWEIDTGFHTEETLYKAVYSRDVNNYVVVYETPQKGKLFKGKGIFNARHDAKSADASSVDLKKNPVNEICVNAAVDLILFNKPIEETIRNCRDISKFTAMRTVKGGGVKDGIYLGKVIRWYHAADEQGEIVYAKSGNKVPDTDGGKAVMQLPKEFPNDVDYDWYIQETIQTMVNMGYIDGEVTVSEEENIDELEKELEYANL